MKRVVRLAHLSQRRFSAAYRPIVNEETLFGEIDAALGCNSGPSLEYLYVVPFVGKDLSFIRKGLYSSANPMGHSAIKYKLPNGSEYVMNIVGKPGRQMVNFMTPSQYLFPNPTDSHSVLGSEQGGVYERSIIGFRLENYPPHDIESMHHFFVDLQSKEKKGLIGFDILSTPLWIRKWIPFLNHAIEKGNCAKWTSRGLVAGKVIKAHTIFPKYLFVKLYLKAVSSYGWTGMIGKRRANIDRDSDDVYRPVNIVYYNQAIPNGSYDDIDVSEGRKKSFLDPSGWISPIFMSRMNRHFRNLKAFAHAHVYLRPHSMEDSDLYSAQIQKTQPWKPPFVGAVWEHD